MLSLMGKMNMEKTDILRMISGLMPSKINILHLWISLMGNLTLAEQVSSQVGGGESKPDLAMEIKEVLETRVKKLLENQMESESKAVKDSVTTVSNTVSALSAKSISTQAQGYRNSLLNISSRLDGRMQKLVEEIIKISNDTDIPASNAMFAELVSLERARLDSIEMALVTKIKEDIVNVSARGSGHSSSHTYLKKRIHQSPQEIFFTIQSLRCACHLRFIQRSLWSKKNLTT